MNIALTIGIFCLAVFAAATTVRKTYQYRNAKKMRVASPDGIAEETFVTIGGIKQWVTIRGEDRGNPVLVIVHGGPGQPYSPFAPLLRPWEKHFTLVQWDQRGAGKTLSRNGKRGCGEISLERFQRDMVEVVEYARKRLAKQKVILLASSAGTLLGIPVIQRRPELFHAYVGSDQNVDMRAGNAFNYELTLRRLREAGDHKKTAQLEKIGADPAKWSPQSYTRKQQLVMGADPLMHGFVQKLLLPALFTSPSYTLRDAISALSDFQYVQEQLLNDILTYDIRKFPTEFSVPFFLFQGEKDILSPAPLAEKYFEEITAPIKLSSPVRNAGHLAMLSQPSQVLQKLITHVLPVVY